jgi:hypothetical protein
MKQISTPAAKTESNDKVQNTDTLPGSSGIPAALFFPSERSVRNIMAFSRTYAVIDSMLLGKFGYFKN